METGYSMESLERGIEACKKNIKTFEDAIDKERNTIKEYRFMIDTIERKKREAERAITIKVNKDEDIALTE